MLTGLLAITSFLNPKYETYNISGERDMTHFSKTVGHSDTSCCTAVIPSHVTMIFGSLTGSIVYNRAIVYKRQKFLKLVVHVIIIEQCNQTACQTKSR